VIAAGVRNGLFNDIDPPITARCLCATLESIILADPQTRDLRADIERVEAVFFKGLLKSSGDRHDA
jgi:hypothetical protein